MESKANTHTGLHEWMNGQYVEAQIGGFHVLIYDDGTIHYRPDKWTSFPPMLPIIVDMKKGFPPGLPQ